MVNVRIITILILGGGVIMGCYKTYDQRNLISPSEAQKFAFYGIEHHNLHLQQNDYSKVLKDTTSGIPSLVQRIDRKNEFYYLVPLLRGEKVVAVVILDAKNGQFMEMSQVRESEEYFLLQEVEAKEILLHKLAQKKWRKKKIISSSLVWQPCEQTQSPYAPLWKFIINKHEFFVSQDKKVFDKLTEPKIFGGAH